MLKDRGPKPANGAIARARRLRRTMTLPEVLLWRVLRTRPHNLKFRRQHPAGPLTPDFYCTDAALAIEVDGEVHGRDDRPSRDARRDAWLAEHGVATLRIPAADILHDLQGVTDLIVDTVRERLPLHHPAARGGPPPRGKLGEE